MKKYQNKIKLSRRKKAHLRVKERLGIDLYTYPNEGKVYWDYPVGDTKIIAWYTDREGVVWYTKTPDVAP